MGKKVILYGSTQLSLVLLFCPLTASAVDYCRRAQIISSGFGAADLPQFVSNFYLEKEPFVKSKVTNNREDPEVIQIAQLDTVVKDDSLIPQQTWCKMMSQKGFQSRVPSMKNILPVRQQGTCAELNEDIFNVTLSSLPLSIQNDFKNSGAHVKYLPDSEAKTGSQWVNTPLKANRSQHKTLELQSAKLLSPAWISKIVPPLGNISGVQYCKLWSEEAARSFILENTPNHVYPELLETSLHSETPEL